MAARGPQIVVAFPVTPAAAFDYLSDPDNRPAWQQSLRGVDVEQRGEHARWRDRTWVPGIRPELWTTTYQPPHAWAESGQWGPFIADLELEFRPTATGSLVGARVRVRGTGMGWMVSAVMRPAIRRDLQRAAALLAG